MQGSCPKPTLCNFHTSCPFPFIIYHNSPSASLMIMGTPGRMSSSSRAMDNNDEEDHTMHTPDLNGAAMKIQRAKEVEEDHTMHTPDLNGAAMKIQRAKEVYKGYTGLQEKPSKREVLAWYMYELCSYFIQTVLIPIVFPLIISQVMSSSRDDTVDGWIKNEQGLLCSRKEMQLYQGLTNQTISVNNLNFSPLEWTSISWVIGLILACPILASISIHLDRNPNHQLITAASIAIGALFCLPAGFVKKTWIFPPYIAAIVAANTIAAASHTRHLGLMVRGYTGPLLQKSEFPYRKEVAGWLSLYATAVGCLGSAVFSVFTHQMLKHSEKFISLWIVSIFSGLKWMAGIAHLFVNNRVHGDGGGSGVNTSSAGAHALSIFRYPHAVGSIVSVFISSFSTMSIFTGVILHLVGNLCLKPVHLLYLWLTYFIFPLLSLPLSHPLQHFIKADALKMQLLGFLISASTSGIGFYFHKNDWQRQHVFLFAALQSTSAGLLHAFGRVLLLDCTPPGKEGAFSAWLSWVRAAGTCAGFAVASSSAAVVAGKYITRCLGIGFCGSIVGIVVLIFGNVSNYEGAVAAGHVIREEGERAAAGSPVHGLDIGIEMKEDTQV